MRAIIVKQVILAGVCALVSGCSYPHAGPSLPDDATTANAASATPPPVLSTLPSVPSAPSFFPSGHPHLPPVSSGTKQTQTGPSNSSTPAENDSLPGEAANNTPKTPTTAMSDSGANAAGGSDQDNAGSNFDNLDVVDSSLKGKLAVLRVGSDPTPNNLLSVFAGLKNKTARPLDLEVQTIYKDKDGNPLNGGSWIPLTLKPHEETEYHSASISADAVDFLVRIRRASDDGAAGTN